MSSPADADDGALSFDRAIPTTPAGEGAAPSGVRCVNCGRGITTEYFTANGSPLCADCHAAFGTYARPLRESGPLVRAFGLGAVAAVAGAVVYYAVIRLFNLEIGLVALLCGWMIGRAMRAGAGGRGGRILQVGAALLTYLSVGMAYVPFVIGGPDGAAAFRIGSALFLAFTLPVVVIVGSFPTGLISAVIIGFGMVQAWQLTAAHRLEFEGPFRVGGGAAS